MTLLMPMICGPHIKVIELPNVTANGNVAIPANHIPLGYVAEAVSGAGVLHLESAANAQDVTDIDFGISPSPGGRTLWGSILTPGADLYWRLASGSWSGKECNLWVILVDLGS